MKAMTKTDVFAIFISGFLFFCLLYFSSQGLPDL